MDYKAKLLELLGLPAEATDDQIANACAALSGEKEKMGAMNSRITELETQLANTDLAAHGITDEGQKKLFAPLLTNKDTRDEALKTLSSLKVKSPPAQIHNRQGAPVPGTDKDLSNARSDASVEEAEKVKAAWIGNRARELQATTPHRPHRDCFAQAEAEFAKQH